MNPAAQAMLVSVFTIVIVTLVPSARSMAAGASKSQAVPQRIILLLEQVSEGGVVSTTVTVCEQVVALPQESVACQARVALNVLPEDPARLVNVLTAAMVTLLPRQLSVVALGASKLHAFPYSTDLSGTHASRIVT